MWVPSDFKPSIPVHAVTIFILSYFTGNIFHLNTYDEYSVEVYKKNCFAPRGNTFVFGAQACADAHLALTTNPGEVTRLAYEIVFGAGANTRTAIRDGYQVCHHHMNHDLHFRMLCRTKLYMN